MSKKTKILICVGAALLALVILVLSLALAGFRLTSKHAVEKMWRDEAVIETDDYDFYYTTANLYGDEAEYIKTFRAVKKSGFLYRTVKTDKMTTRRLVMADGSLAGTVVTVEGDEQFYHFFSLAYNLPAALELIHTTDKFTANGTDVTVIHHSYFTTEAGLSSLSICGVPLNLAD